MLEDNKVEPIFGLRIIAYYGLHNQWLVPDPNSHETFYQWMKNYPEFSEGVARANVRYQESLPAVPAEKIFYALLEYREFQESLARAKGDYQ